VIYVTWKLCPTLRPLPWPGGGQRTSTLPAIFCTQLHQGYRKQLISFARKIGSQNAQLIRKP
jgi:hypothetical protein